MEYSSTIKQEGSLAIYDNSDGPRGHYINWIKSEKNTILSNLYVELKKKKKPHRQKEHFVGCQKYGVEDG